MDPYFPTIKKSLIFCQKRALQVKPSLNVRSWERVCAKSFGKDFKPGPFTLQRPFACFILFTCWSFVEDQTMFPLQQHQFVAEPDCAEMSNLILSASLEIPTTGSSITLNMKSERNHNRQTTVSLLAKDDDLFPWLTRPYIDYVLFTTF